MTHSAEIITSYLTEALRATPAPAYGSTEWARLDSAIHSALDAPDFAVLGVAALRALFDHLRAHLVAERAVLQLQRRIALGELPHGAHDLGRDS